ncbi:hypothetical protein [Psittacicella hinzii]|uniref:Uncharacterized protein n=1 Tax=Psittacicella hinzii TaxID=2028575 RepID=A0A3A1YNK2_9GAMM|nr:hypothetical protein [Psittacicella hinzii]RIY38808.1 hypothetical protein CKF58_03255 [Psittacicella hinzii]
MQETTVAKQETAVDSETKTPVADAQVAKAPEVTTVQEATTQEVKAQTKAVDLTKASKQHITDTTVNTQTTETPKVNLQKATKD